MCDTLSVMISSCSERLSPLRKENTGTDRQTHTHFFYTGLDAASLGKGS